MVTQSVRIIDRAGNLVAAAAVVDEGDYFGGAGDLGSIPGALMPLFDEFELAINDQAFEAADAIQTRLAALELRVVFEVSPEACVDDLQVYPSTGDISFRLPCPRITR